MAAKNISDQEVVGELIRWHDWLSSVEGATAPGETVLETLRRVVPNLLLALELSAVTSTDHVSDLVKPPAPQPEL